VTSLGGKGLVGRELGSGEFGLDWMEGRLRWMEEGVFNCE
jgi:hypothetical protein